MALWRTRRPVVSRLVLLASRPVRHNTVTEHAQANGTLQLAVSLPASRLVRWLSRNRDQTIIHRFELDALGAAVWRMIDGQTTVREMIERFAADHQLNLREAEVAIYLDYV